jgi:hypothetical protein
MNQRQLRADLVEEGKPEYHPGDKPSHIEQVNKYHSVFASVLALVV